MRVSELIGRLMAAMVEAGEDVYLDVWDQQSFAREVSTVWVYEASADSPPRIIIDTKGPEDGELNL